MKECKKCNKEYSLSEFNKSKTNRDGYRTWCKSCIQSYTKKYNKDNKDKAKTYYQEYAKNNRIAIRQRERERLATNPLSKLKSNLRSAVGNSLRKNGFAKNSKTEIILGCSFEEFKLHIESLFQGWMCWENHGKFNGLYNYGWDIDHIVPLNSAKTEDDLIKLNHYTNLQPLCSFQNRIVKRLSQR